MERLYTDLARYWPLISPPHEYAPEAAILQRVISQHFGVGHTPERRRLLELGAGGGHLLSHFTADFDCTAVDQSTDMLEQCRKLNPAVRCVVGDMRTFHLNERFDVVIIHDAIDYMLIEADLQQAIRNACDHLQPNGILLLMPSHLAETFEPSVDVRHVRAGDTDVVFICREGPCADDTSTFALSLIFVVFEDAGPQIIRDDHTCAVFPLDTWQRVVTDCGLRMTTSTHRVADDNLLHMIAAKRGRSGRLQ